MSKRPRPTIIQRRRRRLPQRRRQRLLPSVGILGGGQLARMTAEAARHLGVKVIVLDAEPDSPAGQITHQIVASWTDQVALARLAREIDVLTLENEFVDLEALEFLAMRGVMVRPSIHTFAVVQDKLTQKQAFAKAGLEVPALSAVAEPAEIASFAAKHGWPVVLKTRSLGYDGHGVAITRDPGELDEAWRQLGAGQRPLMVEAHVDFSMELAVMVARSARGEVVAYPVVETVQKDHICHLVRAPAKLPVRLAQRAREVAVRAVEAVEGIGIHGVELFCSRDGEMAVNEIAPRPHNSGHYTIDACYTSQFENHLRAILGLPLGSTAMRAPAAVMANLLASRHGLAPRPSFAPRRSAGAARVHLYGKHELRPGRKMGHVTALGNTLAEAESRALRTASALDL